jgi:CheY-like chemotaxis protein
VLGAASPGEALLLCEKHSGPIDLLVTDAVMPGMNGRELRERLEAPRPGLPALFMSGYTADAIAHRGVLDAGVRFIEKPFSLDALGASCARRSRVAEARGLCGRRAAAG